MIKIYCF